MTTRTKSDPRALRLAPQPPSSGIHRVACLRPVTLETAYTSVSDDSEPTVVLFDANSVRHRARLAARSAADRARADAEQRAREDSRARARAAWWILAACVVAWFAARVIAGLVPVVEPAYFASFAAIAVGGFGFLFFCIGDE